MKIHIDNYEEAEATVDLSIPSCKDVLFMISKVEPHENEDKDYGPCVDFVLVIKEHDDDSVIGREMKERFFEPDPKQGTQAQYKRNVARWKQLCLATGIGPDADGDLDPHDFQGESFRGEIYQRKDKKSRKEFATLGEIHFDNAE